MTWADGMQWTVESMLKNAALIQYLRQYECNTKNGVFKSQVGRFHVINL